MMFRFDPGAQDGHILAMSEPRLAASAALFRGPDVLLIRRAFAPWAGHWSLPGGRLEPGETPEDCVRREVREELGLDLGAVSYVETRALPGFALTVFAARIPDTATPHPNTEIAAWHWQAVDDTNGETI